VARCSCWLQTVSSEIAPTVSELRLGIAMSILGGPFFSGHALSACAGGSHE